MEIRIGIVQAPKEVTLELDDSTDVNALKATIEAGVADQKLIWLTDRKGRQPAIPGDRVAYVELGVSGDDSKIGFG